MPVDGATITIVLTVVGLLGSGLGFLLRGVFHAGQKEKGLSSTVDSHGKRLDDHDERFNRLNTEFVPRPEVERALGAIEKDQRESKQMLLHLVTRRPIDADVNLN